MKIFYIIILFMEIVMSEQSNTQNQFYIVNNKYVIMKVGDEYCFPDYDHPTIKIFNKLRNKKVKNRPKKIVLCLIHSSDSKISIYRYKKEPFNFRMPKPRPIFKMPDSPRHTFIIVDVINPGIIQAVSEKNRLINSINLQTVMDKLLKLKLSVDENKMIDFSQLPHFLYSKIK